MAWLVIITSLVLVGSAGLHHLGPAFAVLMGTGLPLAILALISSGAGLRRMRTGDIARGLALEALGLGSMILLAVMSHWAWVKYF